MASNWFDGEKVKFMKQEKKSLLSSKKKDGSGGGIRLNKGRGGCPPEKQEKIGKGQLTPNESLKLAGNMLLVGGALAVGTRLLGELLGALD